MIVAQVLLAFTSGLALESLAVLWVHYAERNQRLALFLVGTLQGTCHVLGIGESLSAWPCAVGFVLGYGCGPLVGIAIKRRLTQARGAS